MGGGGGGGWGEDRLEGGEGEGYAALGGGEQRVEGWMQMAVELDLMKMISSGIFF